MIALALAAWTAAAADAQWTVTVDPLTTVLGFAHVQVERRLSPRFSLYAGPHARLFDAPWTPAAEREPYLGLGVEVGGRWFPRGAALEGPWVMVRGVVAVAWATDSDARGPAGYGSALGGWTWIVSDHLVLAAGLGVQRLEYGVGDYGIRTWAPAAHSNVGVAF